MAAITYTTPSVPVDTPWGPAAVTALRRCSRCKALVLAADTSGHTAWHTAGKV